MEQISVLQIIGLILFLIIGLCLLALQMEKYDNYRWQIFGTCVACFIGTGIVGYLAFVPTPYIEPEILNDSYDTGEGGGAAGKGTGDGKQKKGGAAGKGSGKAGGGAQAGGGGTGGGGEDGDGNGDSGGTLVGQTFKDCEVCPKMVGIPSGENRIGSKTDANGNTRPTVIASIPTEFAVSQFEITVAEFKAFADEINFAPQGKCNTDGVGGSSANFLKPGMEQRDSHPVVCVSATDAEFYTEWLSKKAGATYRLLSEVEWEYVRRGSRLIVDPTAPVEGPLESGNIKGDLWIARTESVGTYNSNQFKVYDMQGNAAELTQDCWHATNKDLDGTPEPRTSSGNCFYRAVRGGSWDSREQNTRPASRVKVSKDARDWRIGFRVMREPSKVKTVKKAEANVEQQ